MSRIDKLSAVERSSLTKLLSRLKRDFLRPVQLSNDKRVHLMEPTSFHETLPPDSQHKEIPRRYLSWIVLPYFSLEKYSGLESGAGAGGALPVPTQTLLQTQFAHVAKGRDMRQTVCRYGGNLRNELCLHVAQLWCIVLDNCKAPFKILMTNLTTDGAVISTPHHVQHQYRQCPVRRVRDQNREPVGCVCGGAGQEKDHGLLWNVGYVVDTAR